MNFTVEQIERGIFEALRLVLVAHNHLPDMLLYLGNAAGYRAAQQVIRNTPGGLLIDLMNVGDYTAKGELTYPSIIIELSSEEPGDVRSNAGAYAFVFKNLQQKFDKFKMPDSSSNLTYTITAICKSTKQQRLIDRLMFEALPKRGKMKGKLQDGSDTEQTFPIAWVQTVNLSDREYIEKQYRFIVRNVFVQESELVSEVPPILEMEITSSIPRLPKNQEAEEAQETISIEFTPKL